MLLHVLQLTVALRLLSEQPFNKCFFPNTGSPNCMDIYPDSEQRIGIYTYPNQSKKVPQPGHKSVQCHFPDYVLQKCSK